MSQPNFSHLKGLCVRPDATAEFTFDGIEGEPTLTVKPATEANRAFLDAVLLQSKKIARHLRGKGKKMSPEVLAASRDQDRELYPLHVVTGWPVPPVDVEGAPVPFSPEACAAFLRAVPDDMVDRLRSFCVNVDNFRGEEGDEEDAEAHAGN